MREIPKVIHYCWFGKNEKPEIVIRCIESWKKYMPDYEIIEWNEDNFIDDNTYYREALSMGKYAFASDFARLKIVYENGGVYLDTDVEIIKNFEHILETGGFLGFENTKNVATGIGFAAPRHDETILHLLNSYEGISFLTNNGFDNMPCPQRNTKSLVELGLEQNGKMQKIGALTIYPKDYFCPVDYDTGKTNLTANTVSIHHYGYSWADKDDKKLLDIKRKIFRIFPPKLAQFVFNVVNKIRRIFKKNKN